MHAEIYPVCSIHIAIRLSKTEDYEKLMTLTDNYKNHFNKETGFKAPRLSSGEWELSRITIGTNSLIALKTKIYGSIILLYLHHEQTVTSSPPSTHWLSGEEVMI